MSFNSNPRAYGGGASSAHDGGTIHQPGAMPWQTVTQPSLSSPQQQQGGMLYGVQSQPNMSYLPNMQEQQQQYGYPQQQQQQQLQYPQQGGMMPPPQQQPQQQPYYANPAAMPHIMGQHSLNNNNTAYPTVPQPRVTVIPVPTGPTSQQSSSISPNNSTNNNNRSNNNIINNRHQRPPYIDPQTNIVYDMDTPDYEGYLTKQSTWMKEWRRRYFILKGSKLFFCKNEYGNAHGMMDLALCTTVKSADLKSKKRHSFEISTPETCYLLYADSESEKDDWIGRVGKAIVRCSRTYYDSSGKLTTGGGPGSRNNGNGSGRQQQGNDTDDDDIYVYDSDDDDIYENDDPDNPYFND
jgi:PH domain